MIVDAMGSWSGLGVVTLASGSSGGSFMDSLPDPMKLQLPVVGFVIAVLIILFLVLKVTLFKPLTQLMDEREAAIRAGGDTKSKAAAQVEARQAEYAAQLSGLRSKASAHRKTLAAAVTQEKQAILDEARQQASAQREKALVDLKAERMAAEEALRMQIDALSESMAQHLLKQA